MQNKDSFKQEFWGQLLGDVSPAVFSAAVVFALLGLLLITAINVRNGIKNNPNTNSRFAWKDFGIDSFLRVLCSFIITLIIIFISIRFSNEYMGVALTMGYSLIVGLAIDYLTIYIVKLRDKFKQ